MSEPHEISKSLFARYDLVVYLGGGIFSIVAILGSQPFRLSSPIEWEYFSHFSPTVLLTTQIIFLAFSSYIFGHICSYLSDQSIEKYLVSILGYPADWIGLLSSDQRRGYVRDLIRKRLRYNLIENFFVASYLRTIFHLPVYPVYFIAIYCFGMDGFYRSRLPDDVMERIDNAFAEKKLNCKTSNNKWFRIVEQSVINSNSSATARMYNYVVIYGLLRTLCMTTILLTWIYISSTIWKFCKYDYDNRFLIDHYFYQTEFVKFAILTILMSISSMLLMFSFAKFYRRYTEEAIFAFIFSANSRDQALS